VHDHHWASDLVLRLTSDDRLVTDGAEFTSARTPEDVTIGQWPQRAVKESLADAAEEVHVRPPCPRQESYRDLPGRAFCISSEGDPEYKAAEAV
jgi:hypothetical protein